ncbi:hypothetical protein ACJX0J_009018, partial [Zea mays]
KKEEWTLQVLDFEIMLQDDELDQCDLLLTPKNENFGWNKTRKSISSRTIYALYHIMLAYHHHLKFSLVQCAARMIKIPETEERMVKKTNGESPLQKKDNDAKMQIYILSVLF